MINELDIVALNVDLPEFGLKRGDSGTVVMVHRGGEGYTVEFITPGGKTVAVAPLGAGDVCAVFNDEIPHARAVA